MTRWECTPEELNDLIRRGKIKEIDGKPVVKPKNDNIKEKMPTITEIQQAPIKIDLTLLGQPITKKNSMRIMRNHLIQSKAYCAYEKNCLNQLCGKGRALEHKLHVTCSYYMKTAREPDLLNLMAATHDILEKSGIIKNDSQIKSVDGSRIVGKDKKNPRVEIIIENFEG